MKDSTRQKWQQGLAEYLEPDERIEAASRAVGAKFWQLALIMGYLVVAALGRYRTYVVTDRNVYVFQASAWSKYKVTKVLEKRPLASARVAFEKGYLTLDGGHQSFVGLAGPAKRQGVEVVEAAERGVSAGASTQAEPNITA
jgi:hypothetical protein